MIEKEKVSQAIFNAIDEINQQLPQPQHIPKTSDTILSGSQSSLDSLGLVNLVVLTEEQIENEFGVMINIADQKAMAQTNNPFRTIGTLTDYIATVLAEAKNGR